jgi:WD40 repeat protein
MSNKRPCRSAYTLVQLLLAVALIAIVLGFCLADYRGSPWQNVQCAFAPDGQVLAVGSADGRRVHDGVRYVTESMRQTVAMVDVETAKGRATLFSEYVGHGGLFAQAPHVAFSPGGERLAAGAGLGQLRMWKLREQVSEMDISTDELSRFIHGISFSPDESILAAADHSRVVLLDLESGVTSHLYSSGHRFFASNAIAFSSDGSLLAEATDEGVNLWDTSTRKMVRTLGRENTIYAVAFSPHDCTLATAGDDGVNLWDLSTQTDRNISRSAALWVKFSGDGTKLVSADFDDVKFWDVTEGAQVKTISSVKRITTIALSPDGHRLAIGDSDGAMSMWSVDSGDKLWFVRVAGRHSLSPVIPFVLLGAWFWLWVRFARKKSIKTSKLSS